MGLEVHLVSAVGVAPRAEYMVETHFHHRRGREIGGDMAPDAGAAVIGLQHHGRGIPAEDVLDAAFQLDVAGVGRLVGQRDGVLVGRIERRLGEHDAILGEFVLQPRKQRPGVVAAALVENAGESLDPLQLLEFPVGGGFLSLWFRQEPCFRSCPSPREYRH